MSAPFSGNVKLGRKTSSINMGRYNRKILHDLAETRILSSIANGKCIFQE